MIDIELLRKNPDIFRESMRKRNYDTGVVDEFLKLDGEWRAKLQEVEKMRAEQKKLGTDLARQSLGDGGKENIKEKAKALKEKIAALTSELETTESKRTALVRKIPNLILDGVPEGRDESHNVTLREVGKKPTFNFKPKDYVELSERLGIIDTHRAAKVSGSRFGYILGGLAQLEFALIQLAVDTVTDQKLLKKLITKNKLRVSDTPFIPVIPPVLIKHEMMAGMGYVDRGAEEIYNLEKDGLYLVGTSEQSIGPMHAGETFEEKNLPKRYLGFSTCFRREAGSYGRDTKGILRVHQFNKLEMFSITTPELSRDEHQFLLAIEEHLMQQLALPYRVQNICAGDLGDPAAAKYDIEVWLPSENQYRETHSTSNTTDFQSRRLGIKYRSIVNGQSSIVKHVYMLNGTAFSERPLLAIIENYQTKAGTVKVPKVLQRYAGIKEIA